MERTRGQYPAPPPLKIKNHGGDIGSTAIDRYEFYSALYHRYRATFTNANDNEAFAVAA